MLIFDNVRWVDAGVADTLIHFITFKCEKQYIFLFPAKQRMLFLESVFPIYHKCLKA